jgi:hypothetical protein
MEPECTVGWKQSSKITSLATGQIDGLAVVSASAGAPVRVTRKRTGSLDLVFFPHHGLNLQKEVEQDAVRVARIGVVALKEMRLAEAVGCIINRRRKAKTENPG